MAAKDPIDQTRDADPSRERVDNETSDVSSTRHETDPTSAMGGLGGAAIGAAAGSLGGPIGIVIGALAGGAGGWWAGRAVSRAAHEYETDESRFRERHAAQNGSREYETARPAYQLGYLAGRNPEYRARTFEDIEEHVQLGWSPISETHGPWPTVREYARDAYGVAQERTGAVEREVPLARSVESEAPAKGEPTIDLDEELAKADSDPIAHPKEPAQAVYPTEIDALANGIAAEPGSEAAREFHVRESVSSVDEDAPRTEGPRDRSE